MALDSMQGSKLLTKALSKAACTTESGELIVDPSARPDASSFPEDFARGYDEYAMSGVIVGAVSDGGDWNIISSYLRSGNVNVVTFGYALARYWATVNVTPAGGFISVSNTANSLANRELFVNAVRASMTDKVKTPYYKHFIDNIENIALSKVTWTAMQIAVPSPIPIISKIV